MTVQQRWRQLLWAATALYAGWTLACRSEQAGTPPVRGGAEASFEESKDSAGTGNGAAVGGRTERATPQAITPETLQRFIESQKQALKRTLAEADAKPLKDARARLEAFAAHESEAQQQQGLSPEEARRLQVLVGDVLARRAINQATDSAKVLAQLAQLKEKLGEASHAKLDPLMKRLSAEADKGGKLTEERARYGDTSVDLVLSREAELTELWLTRTALLLGKERETGSTP